MTTFFTLDRANARVPEVRELLLLLRAQRRELVELRDRYLTLAGEDADADTSPSGASDSVAPGERHRDAADAMDGGASPDGDAADGDAADGGAADGGAAQGGTEDGALADRAAFDGGAADAGATDSGASLDSGAADSALADRGALLDDGTTLTGLERAELIKLRIKGIVDQMGASVARIDDWGITLRDIESGLIDFPALVDGRQVWLCWRLGEDDVAWWHELDSGFAGRRPLSELGAGRGVH